MTNTDWTNKEQVLEAVSLDGHALLNASKELRADRDVQLAATISDLRPVSLYQQRVQLHTR